MSPDASTDSSQSSAAEHERLWTIEDVCHFLQMGRTWVREQVALPPGPERLPHRYLGRSLRFDPEEVREWWRQLSRDGVPSRRRYVIPAK
jgi:predicted DNA-binding transcriptional regulator AlpA